MGMLIVDSDDFDKELAGYDSQSARTKPKPDLTLDEPAEVVDISRGRGKNNNEVPESLRNVIGELALTEPTNEIQKAFNISPSSISAYKHGATSTASYDNPDKELKDHIADSRARISQKATGKLMSALRHITKDKLEAAKVRELAGIARDMSAVIKNMEPERDVTKDVNAPQFIFYAPPKKQELEYEVIDVK